MWGALGEGTTLHEVGPMLEGGGVRGMVGVRKMTVCDTIPKA